TANQELEGHWAVNVFEPGDRARLLAYARRALGARDGTVGAEELLPEQLASLASAYELAGLEALEVRRPRTMSVRAAAPDRTDPSAYLEAAARNAFLLNAVLPVESDRTWALYHALLLGALAEVGGQQGEFKTW